MLSISEIRYLINKAIPLLKKQCFSVVCYSACQLTSGCYRPSGAGTGLMPLRSNKPALKPGVIFHTIGDLIEKKLIHLSRTVLFLQQCLQGVLTKSMHSRKGCTRQKTEARVTS